MERQLHRFTDSRFCDRLGVPAVASDIILWVGDKHYSWSNPFNVAPFFVAEVYSYHNHTGEKSIPENRLPAPESIKTPQGAQMVYIRVVLFQYRQVGTSRNLEVHFYCLVVRPAEPEQIMILKSSLSFLLLCVSGLFSKAIMISAFA